MYRLITLPSGAGLVAGVLLLAASCVEADDMVDEGAMMPDLAMEDVLVLCDAEGSKGK